MKVYFFILSLLWGNLVYAQDSPRFKLGDATIVITDILRGDCFSAQDFMMDKESFDFSEIIRPTNVTYLHIAIQFECYELAEFLIEQPEVDVHASDFSNYNALDVLYGEILRQKSMHKESVKHLRESLLVAGVNDSIEYWDEVDHLKKWLDIQ